MGLCYFRAYNRLQLYNYIMIITLNMVCLETAKVTVLWQIHI